MFIEGKVIEILDWCRINRFAFVCGPESYFVVEGFALLMEKWYEFKESQGRER